MELFWELRQNRRIDSATQNAQRAHHKADRSVNDFDELQRRVDRLSLGCQALWELIGEKLDLSHEQVLQRMVEIDLRDGSRDGKIGRSVASCPDCKRPAGSHRHRCQYCGVDLSPAHLFD